MPWPGFLIKYFELKFDGIEAYLQTYTRVKKRETARRAASRMLLNVMVSEEVERRKREMQEASKDIVDRIREDPFQTPSMDWQPHYIERQHQIFCGEDGNTGAYFWPSCPAYYRLFGVGRQRRRSAVAVSTKNKRGKGRPTAFKKGYIKEGEKLCRLGGYTIAKLAEHWDVSQPTIYNWLADKPEFLEAIQRGKDHYDSFEMEVALVKRAKGFQYTETTREVTRDKDKYFELLLVC